MADNDQESHEATTKRIEANMLFTVLEDIRSVAPDQVDTVDKVKRAYFGARQEVFATYYDYFHLGNPEPVVLTDGEVAWATVTLMWLKFCGAELHAGVPYPADAFKEECRAHMGRPDETWLEYVARREGRMG
ncbi:hypothetical protein QBC32DRAFT_225812 [Pseudoneurospora amorphoporcata]|uniref:Uncharacterized protein n=1 Tax=Pseudoneurospora amorphoporcata TaxID=241081 RepID=A0AAN6SB87_9PEZI|nr:hypothetical protein QBC32DRAFT_225812 [Pseudoneurospora amorphoporcata]